MHAKSYQDNTFNFPWDCLIILLVAQHNLFTILPMGHADTLSSLHSSSLKKKIHRHLEHTLKIQQFRFLINYIGREFATGLFLRKKDTCLINSKLIVIKQYQDIHLALMYKHTQSTLFFNGSSQNTFTQVTYSFFFLKSSQSFQKFH